MSKIILALAALALVAPFGVLAEDAVEVRRVLVADPGTKPAAAAAQPKFEYIRLKTREGKTNAELLCEDCCKKQELAFASKPAIKPLIAAYACANCGEICWREGGKAVKFTEEKDVKAEPLPIV